MTGRALAQRFVMSKSIALTVFVENYIRKNLMTQTGDLLLVALSGGGDSVCLLCVLKELEQKLGISLEALHVHHGIRDEAADRDAAFCEALCRQLQIPCRIVYADVPAEAKSEKISLEEAARKARYRELESWRQQRQGEQPEGHRALIAVAHHQEDQAETVLWNLFRGSGLKGLGGMAPVNGAVIRPLLGVSKEDILAYLQQRRQMWQQDETNDSDEYTRNRIRHHILGYAREKINERSAEHICRTAAIASRADEYLRRQARKWLEENRRDKEYPFGEIVISISRFCLEEEILQIYILREALAEICGLTDVTARHMEALKRLLVDTPGAGAWKQLDLTENVAVQRSYDDLRLYQKGAVHWMQDEDRENREEILADPKKLPETPVFFGKNCFRLRIISPEKAQNFPTNQYTKWINYDKLEGMLVFRTRRVGDYILLPDGRRKTVKAAAICP